MNGMREIDQQVDNYMKKNTPNVLKLGNELKSVLPLKRGNKYKDVSSILRQRQTIVLSAH